MDVQTHQKKTIHLATDHAGFVLKEEIKQWLKNLGKIVVDHGAIQENNEDDFPDFISKAALAVSANCDKEIAIIFGGSGQGEAMVANRFSNVRATVLYSTDADIVTLSRSHNDANVLSVGARFVEEQALKKLITLWLETPFVPEEKRVRRNKKLEHYSK